MSSKSSGSFSTLLLSLPLAGVALMAVFGVPQFAPVVASPGDEEVIRTRGPMRGRQPEDFFQEFPGVEYGDEAPMFQSAPAADRRYDTADRSAAAPNHREMWGYAAGTPAAPRQDVAAGNLRGDVASAAGTAPRGGQAVGSGPVYSPASASGEGYGEWGGNPFTAVVPDGSASRGPEPSPVRSSHPGQLGWREASRRLTELGIENYHLERGEKEGTFLFVCLFSQASNPNVLHRFEAEAEDPLLAVNKVLQQIDGWLKTQFAVRDPAPFRTSSL